MHNFYNITMTKSHSSFIKGSLLFAVMVSFSFTIQAQEQYHHEIGFHLGGGISTLHYIPPAGASKSLGAGGMTGFGYTGFFSPQWGITTGLDLAFYSGKLTWDYFFLQYPVTPPAGIRGCTTLRGDFYNYTERQYAILTQIPLMLQFQTTGENRFYMAAGFKFAFPVYTAYLPTVGTLEVTGRGNNGQEFRNRPEYGLDTYNNLTTFGYYDLRVTALASGEAGGKWKLNKNWNLYAGLYADYGLDNARKKVPDKQLIAYNSDTPNHPTYYSMLQSYGNEGAPFVLKNYLVAIGLKVRFTTNFGQLFASTRKEPEAAPAPVPSTIIVPTRPPAVVAINPYWRQEASGLKRKVDNYLQAQTYLNYSQRLILDQYAAFLLRYPYLSLTIIGHTCNQGSKESNGRLGLGRADMAKAYLVQQRIAPQRIQILSRGDLDPLVPNTTEANRRMNRRIELTIHE